MGGVKKATRRRAYIAGIGEVLGKRMGVSALELAIQVARKALEDAGLLARDIDALFVGRPMGITGAFAATVGERLSMPVLKAAHTIDAGGATPGVGLHYATMGIEDGAFKAALVIYADNRLTRLTEGTAKLTSETHPLYEAPAGPSIVSMYALLAQRYLFDHGLPDSTFALTAVRAGNNALAAPGALRAAALTVDDVLDSRMISTPLRLLDCCLVSDFAGALVVTSSKGNGSGTQAPIEVLGTGEGHTHDHLIASREFFASGARESSRQAYEGSAVQPSDIVMAQIYDSFTVTLALGAEELGLAKRGFGSTFVGKPSIPINTNGGMLAFHNGGIYHYIEAVNQLRGHAGDRQVEAIGPTVVHSIGGIMSHHATAILTRAE